MNKNIVIVTHGNLAKGYQSALEILVGDQKNVRLAAISAYVEKSNWQQELESFYNEMTIDDLNIIFTDIYGGSVNQEVFLKYSNKPVMIITGINLPIILEVLLTSFSDVTDFKGKLDLIMIESRKQLKVTDLKEKEEEFF